MKINDIIYEWSGIDMVLFSILLIGFFIVIGKLSNNFIYLILILFIIEYILMFKDIKMFLIIFIIFLVPISISIELNSSTLMVIVMLLFAVYEIYQLIISLPCITIKF